jgi:hypothetical protein
MAPRTGAGRGVRQETALVKRSRWRAPTRVVPSRSQPRSRLAAPLGTAPSSRSDWRLHRATNPQRHPKAAAPVYAVRGPIGLTAHAAGRPTRGAGAALALDVLALGNTGSAASPREPIGGLPGRRQGRFDAPLYPFQPQQAWLQGSVLTVESNGESATSDLVTAARIRIRGRPVPVFNRG